MKRTLIGICLVVASTTTSAGVVGSYIGASAAIGDAKTHEKKSAVVFQTTSKTCQCEEEGRHRYGAGMCYIIPVYKPGPGVLATPVLVSGNVYVAPEVYAKDVCGFTKIKTVNTVLIRDTVRFIIEGE